MRGLSKQKPIGSCENDPIRTTPWPSRLDACYGANLPNTLADRAKQIADSATDIFRRTRKIQSRANCLAAIWARICSMNLSLSLAERPASPDQASPRPRSLAWCNSARPGPTGEKAFLLALQVRRCPRFNKRASRQITRRWHHSIRPESEPALWTDLDQFLYSVEALTGFRNNNSQSNRLRFLSTTSHGRGVTPWTHSPPPKSLPV